MQHSPQELKERLLKALDKDYNVVDMPMVLEVFSSLEKFPITRENLEQTRLGRHVNDLRRKTTDKDIAKRAKQLVRKWQKLLQAPNPTTEPSPTVNGEGLASETIGGMGLKGPVAALVSGSSRPASPSSRPGTPSSARSNASPLNNIRMQPGVISSSSDTPPIQQKISRRSPKLSGVGLSSTSQPSSPALASHVGSGDQSAKNPHRNIPPHVNAESSFSSRPGTPTDPLSKTNVANMRKRRIAENSPPLSEPARKLARCDSGSVADNVSPQLLSTPTSSGIKLKIKHERSVNGLVSHAEVKVEGLEPSHNGHEMATGTPGDASIDRTTLRDSPPDGESAFSSRHKSGDQRFLDGTSGTNTPDKWGTVANKTLDRTLSSSSFTPKTPKVKTTAQLIKELHETGQVTLRATPTVTKIAMNQIEKEDDGEESIVPAGAKPRPRRKNYPGIHPPVHSDKSLSQTKKERIQSFLRTAVTPLPDTQEHDSDLNNLLKLKLEPGFTEDVESPPLTRSPSPHIGANAHKINGGFSETNVGASVEGGSRLPAVRAPPLHPSCDIAVMRDPWSHLPPLDLDAIDWSEPGSPAPAQAVDDESVSRLHEEHWAGVNGQYDTSDVWHDWTRCMTLTSYAGSSLHILPYVDIDG